MSNKPIVQQFKSSMQHKYSVGDKVRVNETHKSMRGAEGVIDALMPYTFIAPAYYVNINGSKLALSERSLEKLEDIAVDASVSQ